VKDNRESFYRKIGEKNAKNIENVVGSLGLSHNRYQKISRLTEKPGVFLCLNC
jgi:hypothetical protein